MHFLLAGPTAAGIDKVPPAMPVQPVGLSVLNGDGAIAQLGERYNGIVEVSGSIPLSSTNRTKNPPDGGFFVGATMTTKALSGGDSQIFKRVPEFGFLGGVSKGIR